jgi:aminoglycoside 6'-N-acetyltransferase
MTGETAAPAPALMFRSATDADEPELIAIQHSSAIHHATIDPDRWQARCIEDSAEARRYWHAQSPRSEGIVAVAPDGKLVGMIELWLKRPRGPAGARIPRVKVDIGIAVAPELRGRGVGTALLAAAEAWARQHGAERMMLDLDVNNAGAQRLYERVGYRVEAIAMDKPIEPDPASLDAPSIVRNADGEVVPTLVGDQVILRPVRPSDRAALIEVLRDPSVVAIWDSRGPEHSADELLAGGPHWTVWAIEVEGELAGSIQAAEEEDEDYRHAGIDIILSSRFQNRGLGTDAVRTLAQYLMEIRGHFRLTIDPATSNARAIRSYEKVGFKPVGVMRRYERGVDGTYHDGLLMDLVAGELT